MTKISSLFVAVKQCGLLLGQNRILGQQKFLGQHSSLGLHKFLGQHSSLGLHKFLGQHSSLGLHKFLGQHSSQNLHCLPGLSKVLGLGLAMGVVLTGCGSKKKEESKPVAKAQAVTVDQRLVHRLDSFAHARRPNGKFGLYVYDLTANKPVYGLGTDEAQPVASCLKLLSGVAALHHLGARYMFRTTLYIKGKVVGDTLRGDAILRAGLDPLLQAQDLRMFSRQLRRLGVKAVDGRCVLDLTLHDKVQAEPHWYPWDLSYSHYGILFKGEDGVRKAWKQALLADGIRVKDEQLVNGRTPRGSHGVFRFLRSVDRTTRLMWKNSSNTQATSLLYALGHAVDPRNPDMAASGVKYLRQFLRHDLGLRDTSLVIHDGCGLCVHNHLSPRALVTVLTYAYHDKPIYAQLMQNMSIAGEDGTLRRLLSDPRVKGRIHAKTGTLSHPYGISSLAGYCKGADGHVLAFALLDSEMSVLDAHVLQQKLCRTMLE